MNLFDIDKAYVSPYDKFLAEFERTHPLTASQLKEIKTHQRIAMLRDGKKDTADSAELWQEF